jgi:hypothetical protein
MGGLLEIIITVTPHLEPSPTVGVRIHRANYDAWLGERLLCEATTTTPFLAAARALLAEGADPDAVLVMRRTGTITTFCALGLGRRRERATVALRRILMLPRCLSKGSDHPVLHGRFWAGERPSNIGVRVLLDTRNRRNHSRVLPDRPRISHAGKVLRFARHAGHLLDLTGHRRCKRGR